MLTWKYLFFFSLIFSLLSGTVTTQSSAQSTIKGNVIDTETGGAIEGVSIYLANTTIGTSTSKDGSYILTSSAQGDYKLVFSIVGYRRKVFTVDINPGSNLRFNVQLKPQIIEMPEIEVISSNERWRKDYDFFLKEFIGETEFAEVATIKNPWVLDFEDVEDNNMIARAEKPLIIENWALGYIMHVELVEFIWNRGNGEGVYKIYPRYEEIDTDNDLQMKQWLINRKKTYYGSLSHFFRSLYSDSIKNEHFSVQRMRNIKPMTEGEKKFNLLGYPGMTDQKLKKLKGYKINRITDVSFSYTASLDFGGTTLKIPIKKKSRLEANTKKEIFFIYKDGALLNPISIVIYGTWAKNRVANSLPNNYLPENKMSIIQSNQ